MPSTILILALACSDTETPKETADTADTGPQGDATLPGVTHMGNTARDTAPSTADVGAVGDQNAEFGIELLRTLVAEENLLVSPWSLQAVMAQVYAGASGTTKTTIADGMGWSLDEAAFHEAMNATSLQLDAHTDATAEEPVTVQTTNQAFVTTGYPLGEAWLDTISENYGAGVQELDFGADPAGVADDINAWIAARTGGRITNLITEPMVANSRLLLVNALYFAASWDVPFTEEATADGDFTLLDGSTVTTPIMTGSVNVRGAAGDGYFLAELPYTDPGLVMTIVLPDEGRFSEVAAALNWADIADVIDATESCSECTVSLPSFSYESSPKLMDALEPLGLADIIGGSYGGINDALTLTAIEQMTFIAVNERGTEAAAATVASFDDSASIPPFGPVIVDRPFLYFLRETGTNTVLFAGALVDPR